MSENGWTEARQEVRYRLDQTDAKIDQLSTDVQTLSGRFTRIEERSKWQARIWGSLMGFLAGLTGWLK